MDHAIIGKTAASAPVNGVAVRSWRSIGGFRRLALVLCAAWCVGITTVCGYELLTRQLGYFVALRLPVGTVVSGNQATLPDGRVVLLERPLDVRQLAPGQIEWADQPGVVQLQTRTTLLALVLAIPFLGLAVLEAMILSGRWIVRGFKRREGEAP
jgi:hypothetical protein